MDNVIHCKKNDELQVHLEISNMNDPSSVKKIEMKTKDGRTLYVERDILITHSPVFESLLESTSEEAKNGTITCQIDSTPMIFILDIVKNPFLSLQKNFPDEDSITILSGSDLLAQSLDVARLYEISTFRMAMDMLLSRIPYPSDWKGVLLAQEYDLKIALANWMPRIYSNFHCHVGLMWYEFNLERICMAEPMCKIEDTICHQIPNIIYPDDSKQEEEEMNESRVSINANKEKTAPNIKDLNADTLIMLFQFQRHIMQRAGRGSQCI